MKIKETIERECCESKDLIQYRGLLASEDKDRHIYFCRHCGELWTVRRDTDAAGGTELVYVRLLEGRTAEKAMMELVKHGGAWVSSNECSVAEIATARAQERWFQIESLGFVRKPSKGKTALECEPSIRC